MTTATAAALEAAWAERVRANRDQVERVREVPDRDFYAPVSSLFVADPRRTGRRRSTPSSPSPQPGDRWLDIGAAPVATRCRSHRERARSSPSSRRHPCGTRSGPARRSTASEPPDRRRAWPEVLETLGEPPVAEVALVAHVGYDIEDIGPFVDAMERAASRLCVAMLTDRSPASVADPFWPIVHGMERIPLPALPEMAELLRARGRTTEIQRVERAPRTFDSFDGLATFIRRQLWIAEDGEKEQRFRTALAAMARERDDDGWTLASPPVGSIGILTWPPPRQDD